MRDTLAADPDFDILAALETAGDGIRIDPRDMTQVIDEILTEANPGPDSTARMLDELTESLCQLENTLGTPTFLDPHAPDDSATTEAGVPIEDRTAFRTDFTISDRYQFIDVIKLGGQAVVCRARDVELNRTVAIKIPHVRGRSLETASQRIVVEARITGLLNHPAVIPIFALDKRPDGRPFLVLPYYPQGEFTNDIRQLHPGSENRWIDPTDQDLKIRSIVQSMVQVCRAVAFAHERGIVHRDIKPGNILIGDHGEVFLADWGLAKNLRKTPKAHEEMKPEPSSPSDSKSTEDDCSDYGGGTPIYMSKEQALGEIDLQNEKTDIFLLGATLYSMIYGHPPFKDRSSAASYEVEFPRSTVRGIDRSLIDICRKAMAETQLDRYPTAVDLASDLERWLADRPLMFVKERPAKIISRFSRRFSRTIAAAALILMAGTVSLLIMNDRIAAARDKETIAKEAAIEAQKKEAVALEKAEIALEKETKAKEAAIEAQEKERIATKRESENFKLATELAIYQFQTIARKLPLFPGTEKIREEASSKLTQTFATLMKMNPRRADVFALTAQVEREAGNIGRFVGDKVQPQKHYSRALAIWNALLKNDPENPNYLMQKALTLRDYSLWFERMASLDDAEKRSEEAIEIIGKLRAIGKNPEIDELEIFLLSRKGDLLATLGRDEEVSDCLDRIETLLDGWFGKTREPSDQDRKISVGAKLARGNQLLRTARFENARDKFAEAFEEARVNQDRDQDFRLLMGEARFGKARALHGLKDQDSLNLAKHEMQEAFRTMDALRNDSPNVKVYVERVATTYTEMLRSERLDAQKFGIMLDHETASKWIENLIAELDGPELRSLRAQFLIERAYLETEGAKRQELAARAAADLDHAIEKLPLRKDFRKEREAIRKAFCK